MYSYIFINNNVEIRDFITAATKLRQGNIFTPVCFCSRGGECLGPGRRLGGLAGGVSGPRPKGEVGGSGRGVSRPTARVGWGVSKHALRQTPPPPEDGYCCGRYASYWNAFFIINEIEFMAKIKINWFSISKYLFNNNNRLLASTFKYCTW